MSGNLKTYDTTGDSGQPVHRNFCPECGSPILSVVEAVPGASWIKAGTFDDTSWLRPAMDIWRSTAQGWLPMLEVTQKFDKGPG